MRIYFKYSAIIDPFCIVLLRCPRRASSANFAWSLNKSLSMQQFWPIGSLRLSKARLLVCCRAERGWWLRTVRRGWNKLPLTSLVCYCSSTQCFRLQVFSFGRSISYGTIAAETFPHLFFIGFCFMYVPAVLLDHLGESQRDHELHQRAGQLDQRGWRWVGANATRRVDVQGNKFIVFLSNVSRPRVG